MNEELDSQLSAMFDDELSHAECELLARRLSRDTELKSRWGRYAMIAAAIRAERGVRLHVQVAHRVSALVISEPALGAAVVARGAPPRWWRPLAGVAVAAGVAAVSILWLRGQAPLPGSAPPAPLTAAADVRALPAAAPVAAALPARAPAGSDSYVVPPAAHGTPTVVPPTEFANYVVAHSMFTAPVARGNLLSAFMTSESGTAGTAAMLPDAPQDPPRDAPRHAQ
jgi:sigma-E factor negative regulatory protein RseA